MCSHSCLVLLAGASGFFFFVLGLTFAILFGLPNIHYPPTTSIQVIAEVMLFCGTLTLSLALGELLQPCLRDDD